MMTDIHALEIKIEIERMLLDIDRLLKFDPQQPRDSEGRWTGGIGGGIHTGEATGRYAGQYAGDRRYLTGHTQKAYDAILDGNDDIELSAPIQRQTKFYVRSKITKNSAQIIADTPSTYHVVIYKPKIGSLGSSPTAAKKFDSADDLGKFTVNELRTPRTG